MVRNNVTAIGSDEAAVVFRKDGVECLIPDMAEDDEVEDHVLFAVCVYRAMKSDAVMQEVLKIRDEIFRETGGDDDDDE